MVGLTGYTQPDSPHKTIEETEMKKRFRMSPKSSRRQFKRSASRTHRRNIQGGSVMRGGIRL